MISYKYTNENSVVNVTPVPLFWETFDLAGDDLLKELIQQIIAEGKDSNGTGIIENYLKINLTMTHIELS